MEREREGGRCRSAGEGRGTGGGGESLVLIKKVMAVLENVFQELEGY